MFGAWTAHHLQQQGAKVTLIDAFGPANSKSSSGGELRVIRAAYGKDDIYSRMAMDSLPQWQELSKASGLPIFIPAGVLFFFPDEQEYLTQTVAAHEALGLPSELLDQREMQRRFPMIDFTEFEVRPLRAGVRGADGAALGPDTGRTNSSAPAAPIARNWRSRRRRGDRLDAVRLADGDHRRRRSVRLRRRPVAAQAVSRSHRRENQPHAPGSVLFRAAARRPLVTRSARCRCGPISTHGDMYYGFPDLEARGVEVRP